MNIILKATLFLVGVCISVCSNAQQDAHYSHFMFNEVSYNPAKAGTDEMINAILINRNQWMGMEGSPNTTMLCADMPLSVFGLRNGGAGVTILNDKQGFETNFITKLAYAYHINVGTGKLSFGVDAGLFNKSIEGDWKFPDETESIFNGKCRKMICDVGAGVYYVLNNFSLGLSSTHITEPALDFSQDGTTYLARHFYFTGKYNIQPENSLFELTPALILMSDLSSYQFDINFLVTYNKKIWGGVTYRNKDALVLMAGLTILQDFKVGLAYELGISKLRKTNMGSFEIMFGYSFLPERTKPAQKSRSVRFL